MKLPIEITRRLEFDAAHRVLRHESKCRHLHGHRYVVEITCQASNGVLDDLQRVVDFSVVKQLVGEWIDSNWDHNILLNSQDPLLMVWREYWTAKSADGSRQWSAAIEGSRGAVFANKEPFTFADANPTAETIAVFLLDKATELLSPCAIVVTRIRVYETPNCWADAVRVVSCIVAPDVAPTIGALS